MSIPADRFVRTWQAATSVEQVAARLRILPASASVRASRLRKVGVNLKRFPSGRKPLDPKALDKIARGAS